MTDQERCLDDAAYVLGALTPADRQEYEKHLAGCARCQGSVARLAGMPALLAMATEPKMSSDPGANSPPATLRASLIAKARSRRSRRDLLAAAAALVVGAGGTAGIIALRGAGEETAAPGGSTAPTAPTAPGGATAPTAPTALGRPMEPVRPLPLAITMALNPKQWGTSIVMNCQYEDDHDTSAVYRIVITDRAEMKYPIGGWKAVVGNKSTITTATDLAESDIAEVNVLAPDGQTLFHLKMRN